MKVIKEVTATGTVNHRDAYFKAALCIQDSVTALVFAVTLRNPEDEESDIKRVKDILNGRIRKRFLKGIWNSKIEKLTNCIPLSPETRQLCSINAMQAMLAQFKRVKERDLANELGLKWKPQEGEIVKELSVENPISTEHV